MTDAFFKTSQLEAADAPPRNTTSNPTMGELISARFSRRGFLQGSLAVSAIAATVSPLALLTARDAKAAEGSAFSFTEVEAGIDENHHVAEGYDADILLRWGDGIFADSPEFDPAAQSAAAQERQFGYNNDYGGYVPLEGSSEHGLLVVNHEYTNPHLMFPGIVTLAEGEMTLNPLSKE
ncbi:PhoX family protein, partial [Devosia sp.]|uniref:PhoX family protein n=1 Tax=Devosia sp. TaxID=1871048 RepID=UPI002FC741DA